MPPTIMKAIPIKGEIEPDDWIRIILVCRIRFGRPNFAGHVAALEIIYPGRRVEAGVLYTQTPQLFALPAQRLAAYKSAFAAPQESFALPPVE